MTPTDCPNCGIENDYYDLLCPECGYPDEALMAPDGRITTDATVVRDDRKADPVADIRAAVAKMESELRRPY